MKRYVQSDLARLERAGVRVRILGRREGLTKDVLSII